MLGIVNSSSLMRALPGPAVDEVLPPLLSGLGHPHRHNHPVVGPSTTMVSAPTTVAPLHACLQQVQQHASRILVWTFLILSPVSPVVWDPLLRCSR